MSGACAVPHGSFARPVVAPSQGASLLGVGVMVPLLAKELSVGSEGLSNLDDLPRRFDLVPAASYDYHFSSRHSLGLEVAYADTDASGYVLLHPRWELALNPTVSLTADLALGLGGSSMSVGPGAQLSLTFGARLYLPLPWGGFVLSQQLGTGILSVFAPGSVAYDFPIRLSERVTLHVFPETRWDPTITYAVPSLAGPYVFVSGGLSTMLEF